MLTKWFQMFLSPETLEVLEALSGELENSRSGALRYAVVAAERESADLSVPAPRPCPKRFEVELSVKSLAALEALEARHRGLSRAEILRRAIHVAGDDLSA